MKQKKSTRRHLENRYCKCFCFGHKSFIKILRMGSNPLIYWQFLTPFLSFNYQGHVSGQEPHPLTNIKQFNVVRGGDFLYIPRENCWTLVRKFLMVVKNVWRTRLDTTYYVAKSFCLWGIVSHITGLTQFFLKSSIVLDRFRYSLNVKKRSKISCLLQMME